MGAVAGTRWILFFLLVTIPLVAPGTAKGPETIAACNSTDGRLTIPIGSHSPPLLVTRSMEDVAMAHWIEGTDYVQVGKEYSLVATDPKIRQIPDFDIFWYDVHEVAFEEQFGNSPGDEHGKKVPSGAARGIVFMAHGPGPRASAEFVYSVGC